MDQSFRVSAGFPRCQGLYDSALERDACGVGFIADLKGKPCHSTVVDALQILVRLRHRGATGVDPAAGDGAGILLNMPDEFLRDQANQAGVQLPQLGEYGVGAVFLPQDQHLGCECKQTIAQEAEESGLELIWWRLVPVDNYGLGAASLKTQPVIEQVFVKKKNVHLRELTLEQRMYLARKRIQSHYGTTSPLYFCSFSSKILVYKGQFNPSQLITFFPDLSSEQMKATLALVHSRFSTNTFPSWERAQPLRMLCHNGEINALRGNKNWMKAREGVMSSAAYGELLSELFPVIESDTSDSGALDNALEMLVLAGKNISIAEAIMKLIPEAWQNDPHMNQSKKAFYEFSSMTMEPWDGPAFVSFTNGDLIGCVLDRNGLRPGCYCITTDSRVICASETGVIDLSNNDCVEKGRLRPGRVFLVDLTQGRFISDQEAKQMIVSSKPYVDWLQNHRMTIDGIPSAMKYTVQSLFPEFELESTLRQHLCVFNFTQEIMDLLLAPMVNDSYEALGSMGNDVPLAVLSDLPRLPFDYFKQSFAQVTNPPIDPIREKIITSLLCPIGPQGNLLEPSFENAGRLMLPSPILLPQEFARLYNMTSLFWRPFRVDMSFPLSEGASGLENALDRICDRVVAAIRAGYHLIALSHREVGPKRVPISSLFAVGAVHHHLIDLKLRSRIGLLVECGDAKEVHHFCCLLGFGADAICPYLTFRALLSISTHLKNNPEKSFHQYQCALNKGITKVMAKMGISTLQSYKGAQMFEALGLHGSIMARCFRHCSSRISGAKFSSFSNDAIFRHQSSFGSKCRNEDVRIGKQNYCLGSVGVGEFHWRQGPGTEIHTNSPEAIALLQQAARTCDRSAFEKFTAVWDALVSRSTLRGLLHFKQRLSVPLEEVEAASSIVKRFCTGAMSFGSISRSAHMTLAAAMNRIGGKSNSGEGGEESDRYSSMENENSMRSKIKQVASGRFGVSASYLSSADEIQIKMAQGAKPGEGGELPGHKVFGRIAQTRRSVEGVGLISPPPHHDIYSIEDLAQLIYDLKCVNDRARISVKLASQTGVGVVASGVVKGKAEHLLISGHDGGTGAARWTGIKHTGVPWELGLAETHQTLVLNGLRNRVVLQTDGQLRSGTDVVKAAMLGAEEFGFATAPLIVLGCTMMRKCHLNTCPYGIATQDPILEKNFKGQPEHVINYMFMIAEQVRTILASLGCRFLSEVVGRSDFLCPNESFLQAREKTRNIDLTPLLHVNSCGTHVSHINNKQKQEHHLEDSLDADILSEIGNDIRAGQKCFVEKKVLNTHRAVGAQVCREVIRAHGENGLPEGKIAINLSGSAGQSFGAWLVSGVELNLEGDANDYIGKGMSGGVISIFSSFRSTRPSSDSIIVGNVALYGATGGYAFVAGVAAERFAVRNSGAHAVVEGVGDHACEYMTRGVVLILGNTGRNFAAGMSGGIAYVVDEHGTFEKNVNPESVDLAELTDDDERTVISLLREHVVRTQSCLGKNILSKFSDILRRTVKVYPKEYRKVIEGKSQGSAVLPSSAWNDCEFSLAEKCENHKHFARSVSGTVFHDSRGQFQGGVCDIEDVKTRPASVLRPNSKHGFLLYSRKGSAYRDPLQRARDFEEIIDRSHACAEHPSIVDDTLLSTQASRCMDCGIPFCHQEGTGCPLGNRIPEFNTLVRQGHWQAALRRLEATNPFPEFTGRVCPAPCESACTLAIIDDAVAIKSVEFSIAERGFENGWIVGQPPIRRSDKGVAVVGSGPAGLSAAQYLNAEFGYNVVVMERDEWLGGLLMYGVPNMKLSKKIIDRRIQLLREEGISFRTHINVGVTVSERELLSSGEFDAVVLATGSTRPRDLPITNRHLKNIYFAMEFLKHNARALLHGQSRGDVLNAFGKRVIVIGGGDTGNDCIATALRQGAKRIVNFELMPSPPKTRDNVANPWPQFQRIFRVDYGHEDTRALHGYDPREYCILSKSFIADAMNASVAGISTVRVRWRSENGRWVFDEIPHTTQIFKADMVLLAMGFLGPERTVADALHVELDSRSNYKAVYGDFSTSREGVFACGDCRRGQSLVVWGIAEGRQCARKVHEYLQQKATYNKI